ncbi:hypothetical protein [Alteromonas gracilis]|uniref:hypothetical protein n=1 Tax=Alteromonas gracilis TaxID=1479524 RepID=UPI003736FA7C
MTLNEYIDHKKLAININFVMRHASSMSGKYLRQDRANRRRKVRSLIREVRMASSPETAFMVKAVVAELPSPATTLH